MPCRASRGQSLAAVGDSLPFWAQTTGIPLKYCIESRWI